MIVEVTVQDADVIFSHHKRLLRRILRTVFLDQPVVIVRQLTVLVGNADDFLVRLSPALVCPADLYLDHLCRVLLNVRMVELVEEFAHDERALVLDEILLDSLLLVLGCLVHESEHRVDSILHRLHHVVIGRDLKEG